MQMVRLDQSRHGFQPFLRKVRSTPNVFAQPQTRDREAIDYPGMEEKAMSRRIGKNIALLERTPDAKCELCGKVAELRPYGPRGENICFECGMKNKATTERQMNRVLYGDTEQ